MSKQKKNTGCASCEHHRKLEYGEYSFHRNLCNSELVVKRVIHEDYLNAKRVVETHPIPEITNKNLTCKGFTPIDYKAKYEAEKVELDKWKDTDMDYDVQYVTLERLRDSNRENEFLHKGAKYTVVWLFTTNLFWVILTVAYFLDKYSN